MLQRQLDEGLINTFVGNEVSRGLSDLKVQLALIQSACTMSLEGITRATASQIAARTFQSYKVEVTASFTGQTLSNLNISSVTTHGKNKFVLDAGQLEEIRKDIASKCEAAMTKLQTTVEKFQELPNRIEGLQAQWKQACALRSREQELIRFINDDRQNPPRLGELEAEYKKIEQRSARIKRIEKEINKLETKEKKLSSLKERKEAIEARIAEHEKKSQALLEKEREITLNEQETAKKEAALAVSIEKLQKRLGWVDMATLNENIETAKRELEQLSQQLGEKRSLLDIFRRNKGGKE